MQWRRDDRLALVVLLAVPVALFVLPAIAGHPAIVGDNELQNYPLRVLSGRQLAAGHWPVWNPLADSGTPLLGGMNAGSLYPGSLLFAVLPGLVAWTANLVFVYWCAGIGLFVLARWLGVGTLGAAVGALTYAFGGTMVGQLVHVAVVQGQAWLPWLVLSQLALARAVLGADHATRARDVAARALPGVVGVAASIGLICLTAEPRSIVDAEMVTLIVLIVELVAHGGVAVATVRGRVAYALATATGLAWGVALALVQLLPGWGFIALSERSSISYNFFGAGSLRWQWFPLLFSQGLLGGNGIFGTASFFGSYNLPEVTGYVGLLALVALFAFGAQLVARASTAPRRRLLPFFALAVGGVVLTLGNTTPLGPVLHLIPLFGRTRLQNRNLALLDLGAAVLLGWWLDAVFRGRRAEASLTSTRRVATLLPVSVAAALSAAALASPTFVTRYLPADRVSAAVADGIRLLVGLSFVVAVAYLVILIATPRRSALTVRALLVVAAVDLVGFNVFFQSGLVSGLTSPFPDAPAARALLGTTGRFAIVDQTVAAYHQTAPLGFANLNVFTGLESVQGYGSLISGGYSERTGTRHLSKLDGCALARGVFGPLRLSAIAAATNVLVDSADVPRAPHGCAPLGRSTVARRYFGRTEHVARLTFTVVGHGSLASPSTAVHLLDGHGRRVAAPVVLAGTTTVTATLPTRPLAAAVVLAGATAFRLRSTVLTDATGDEWRLDTPMQVGLDSPTWRFTGTVGQLSFFRATAVAPAVWLASGRPSAHVVSTSTTGSATVAVSTAEATTLVRSEAWLPGWTATIARPDGTGARPAAVRPYGLVQSVAVPSGSWSVAFRYRAPHLRAGIVASAVALAALVVAVGWLARARRRRGPAS